MATLIERPTTIQAAGTPPKQIEEFIGLANSKTEAVSIARMRSPSGWKESGQTAEFDEYTVVLNGSLHVHLHDDDFEELYGFRAFFTRHFYLQIKCNHEKKLLLK